MNVQGINSAHLVEFLEACQTGNTSSLEQLINEGKFRVNESVYADKEQPALSSAIEEGSLIVATLLLTHGANPNVGNGLTLDYPADLQPACLLSDSDDESPKFENPLTTAVRMGQISMVQLLIDHGAKITTRTLHMAILMAESERSSQPEVTEIFLRVPILELLLERAGSVVEGQQGIDKIPVMLGKYSRLCTAVLHCNEIRVATLLKFGDYSTYSGVLGRDYKPTHLALRFNRPKILKAFADADVFLEDVFWEAVRIGNFEVIELFIDTLGFDLQIRNHRGYSVLDVACEWGKLEVVKFFVNKYNLNLNTQDSLGRTPLFHVWEYEMLRDLLFTFPELNLNLRTVKGNVLLRHKSYWCELHALLLEHGADANIGEKTNRHDCPKDDCDVTQYLQKLVMIDADYVCNIVDKVLPISMRQFKKIEMTAMREYETEIAKMRNLRISCSTKGVSGKSLYDFMLLKANATTRYVRNEVLLGIYEKYQKNFCKFMPHYGFILNYQLRRGTARRERMESAGVKLSNAIKYSMPPDFTEFIFGNFSNSSLQRFIDAKLD